MAKSKIIKDLANGVVDTQTALKRTGFPMKLVDILMTQTYLNIELYRGNCMDLILKVLWFRT